MPFSRGDAPGYGDYGRWPIGILARFRPHPSNFSLPTSVYLSFRRRILAFFPEACRLKPKACLLKTQGLSPQALNR